MANEILELDENVDVDTFADDQEIEVEDEESGINPMLLVGVGAAGALAVREVGGFLWRKTEGLRGKVKNFFTKKPDPEKAAEETPAQEADQKPEDSKKEEVNEAVDD